MSYWGILTGLASPDYGVPVVTSDVVYEVRAIDGATGDLVTSLNPTFTFFVDQNGQPLTQPAIAELSGMGIYRFTYAPTTEVSWRIDLGDQMAAGDRYIDGVCSTSDTSGTLGYYLRRIFGWMFWKKEVNSTTNTITYYDGDGVVIGTQTITGNESVAVINKEVAL